MKTPAFIPIVLLMLHTSSLAQQHIQGRITDRRGAPIPGANVHFEGSYDGATSDAGGHFVFETSLTGIQVLTISHIGYAVKNMSLELPNGAEIPAIVLQESVRQLEGVVITAGTMQASTDSKNAVLRPLDIAMTAGATADITGALNTLPGTQRVGEDGRLFVRGGTPDETKVFIDGLLVNAPYNSSLPNLPTRNRFSPFMFKGTTFSTGGYSAEYGQALSSVLLLSTKDIPPQSQTDISLMTVGLGLAHTEAGEKSSLTLEGSYTNLWPYFAVMPQEVDWSLAPQGWGISAMYRLKVRRNGLWKTYIHNSSDRMHTGPDQPGWVDASTYLRNDFVQINSSYSEVLNEKLSIYAGAALNSSRDQIRLDTLSIKQQRIGGHIKVGLDYQLNDRFAFKAGQELLPDTYQQEVEDQPMPGQHWHDLLSATFAEAELSFSGRLLLRTGVRMEYSTLNRGLNAAPRLSASYKTGSFSQISAAWGIFYQQPVASLLGLSPMPRFERARHALVNYQWNKSKRLFRAELYHKEYGALFRLLPSASGRFRAEHSGHGFARGFEFFWRDRMSLKNTDYWVSYSFVDSRRLHVDFPQAATPGYVSAHNFSIVIKHFISPLKTQAGLTYSFASGRPYTDPNRSGFMNAQTPAYHDLSANFAYLIRPHIILYLSGSNLPGFDNVFGYRFSPAADADGHFAGEPVGPPAPRFLFAGLFITLSTDRKSNQLDNL